MLADEWESHSSGKSKIIGFSSEKDVTVFFKYQGGSNYSLLNLLPINVAVPPTEELLKLEDSFSDWRKVSYSSQKVGYKYFN